VNYHYSSPSIAEESIGSSCLDGVGVDSVWFTAGTSTWMEASGPTSRGCGDSSMSGSGGLLRAGAGTAR
jgi:hypothetical protein